MGAAPPAARPEAEAEVLQTTSRGVFASDEDFMTLAVLARDASASVFRFHREAVERMARGDEEEDEGDDEEDVDDRGRLDFGEEAFFLLELLSDIEIEEGSVSFLSPSWA